MYCWHFPHNIFFKAFEVYDIAGSKVDSTALIRNQEFVAYNKVLVHSQNNAGRPRFMTILFQGGWYKTVRTFVPLNSQRCRRLPVCLSECIRVIRTVSFVSTQVRYISLVLCVKHLKLADCDFSRKHGNSHILQVYISTCVCMYICLHVYTIGRELIFALFILFPHKFSIYTNI